mmetsp:Transcript_48497/g.87129  ORF Transcript_48497/g.87129 Transcript_48497/m.87129 type:complete len:106 (+) Transcript_48497:1996-2313(+)
MAQVLFRRRPETEKVLAEVVEAKVGRIQQRMADTTLPRVRADGKAVVMPGHIRQLQTEAQRAKARVMARSMANRGRHHRLTDSHISNAYSIGQLPDVAISWPSFR